MNHAEPLTRPSRAHAAPAWLLAALAAAPGMAVPPSQPVDLAQPVNLSSPVGLWTPLDWSTGKPMGLIRIYEEQGQIFGSIVPMGPDDETKLCTRCTDDRKNHPYSGLVLMRHLRWQDGEYVGGDILDPGTGSIYGCKLRLIDGGHRLIMRGFLGISLLGRSQTWQRVESLPHS